MFSFGAIVTKGGVLLWTNQPSYTDLVPSINRFLVSELLEGKNATRVATQLEGRRTIQWTVQQDLIFLVRRPSL